MSTCTYDCSVWVITVLEYIKSASQVSSLFHHVISVNIARNLHSYIPWCNNTCVSALNNFAAFWYVNAYTVGLFSIIRNWQPVKTRWIGHTLQKVHPTGETQSKINDMCLVHSKKAHVEAKQPIALSTVIGWMH